MALYNFHRVLIAATILFAFGLALWAYREGAGGDSGMMTMAVICGIISAGLVGYLIYFNYKTRILTRGESRE